MKIYISADIEGITGVTHWDETELTKGDYAAARDQMAAEVIAACEGAMEGGASEVWVRDAHDSARNLLPGELPDGVRLMRGWSGHPFMMLDRLDASFAALMMIGYHSGAGFGGSPLEHTMSGNLTEVRINGAAASEFTLAAYTAGLAGVPPALVSGDRALCEHVQAFNPRIHTVAVKEGAGNATINLHPAQAIERIRRAATDALRDPQASAVTMPDHFRVEVEYRNAHDAYRWSFYPGARLAAPTVVEFVTPDWFDALRFLSFAL